MSDWEARIFMCGLLAIPIALYISLIRNPAPKNCSTCLNYEGGKCRLSPIYIDVNDDHWCSYHT